MEFPPDLTRRTLAKMRDHLFALQEITEALARGQNDQAARVAEERLGMSAMRLHGAHEVAKYMPQGMKDGRTREYVRICITSKPSNAPPHHIVLRKHVANLLGRIATASEQNDLDHQCECGFVIAMA